MLAFKKQFPKKVTLLLGNHDWQYLFHGWVGQCTGYNRFAAPTYYSIFTENQRLFKVAYEPVKNIVFSHAGITKEFLGQQEDLSSFVSELNSSMFNSQNVKWTNQTNGCLWVRPNILNVDYIKNVTQVVGHTAVPNILKHTLNEGENFIYYTDVLANSDSFLELKLS